MDRYLLISADGHAGPPAELYRHYLDPGYHQRFDEHQAEQLAIPQAAGYGAESFEEWEAKTGDGGLTGAYDSDVRNEMLDSEGVAAEVLFPDADVMGTGRLASSPFGSGLASSGDSDPGAGAGRGPGPQPVAGRLRGRPTRPPGGGGGGAHRPRHRRGGGRDRGGQARSASAASSMPTRWMTEPAYHDPRYEPVWSTIEELGLVLHTHSGSGPADYEPGPGYMAIYATEAWWWAARPLWVLLWSGVFERHPGLRYVIAENGAWWLPDLVAKMDEKYLGGHNTKSWGTAFTENLSMKPSEYIDRNCFLAASTPGVEDIDRMQQVGMGNLLWGSDFPTRKGGRPHPRDGAAPVQGRGRARRPPRAGPNTAELYGLDVDALAPLVGASDPGSTRSTPMSPSR